MDLNIITRESWGAANEMEPGKELKHPAMYIFTMSINRNPCDTVSDCAAEIQSTQAYHVYGQSQPDIRHNFIVTSSGVVFEGRGWYIQPLLPHKFRTINPESILIGYHGGGLTADTMPKKMARAGQLLVEYGVKNGFISKFFLYNDQMTYQSRAKEMRETHRLERTANRRNIYN
ncbi:peptidoglycan recognition protein 1-like [Macrosteles quadrilineatus]|uniref:peptidoglycan recognition protein 1-like n=1 Tax=Macrosteles quadrilineatus TaxID=74068 RepID=UPI0023E1A34B|nr:peptidoglycan recognition protein 1-like [Macrosteles quadrilineatus]